MGTIGRLITSRSVDTIIVQDGAFFGRPQFDMGNVGLFLLFPAKTALTPNQIRFSPTWYRRRGISYSALSC